MKIDPCAGARTVETSDCLPKGGMPDEMEERHEELVPAGSSRKGAENKENGGMPWGSYKVEVPSIGDHVLRTSTSVNRAPESCPQPLWLMRDIQWFVTTFNWLVPRIRRRSGATPAPNSKNSMISIVNEGAPLPKEALGSSI